MGKEEMLQAFLDYLRGVEDLELCYESNDCESDQRFCKSYKEDEDMIGGFLASIGEE